MREQKAAREASGAPPAVCRREVLGNQMFDRLSQLAAGAVRRPTRASSREKALALARSRDVALPAVTVVVEGVAGDTGVAESVPSRAVGGEQRSSRVKEAVDERASRL